MADSKNAFEALKGDTGASWGAKAKSITQGFSSPTAAKIPKKVLEQKKYKDNPDLAQKVKRAYGAVISDISSALNLGKAPKREDFINAIKKIKETQQVLKDALEQDQVLLDLALIDQLIGFVKTASDALEKEKGEHHSLPGAAYKTVKDKAKSTGAGIVSGMASQLTEGIPFAPEILSFAGAKIKGAFGGGGASSSAKDMASILKGADDDGNGGAEDLGGTVETVEKAKEELLGGKSTGGGGGAGGGLEFTNELLISIEDHLEFIRKNTETAETRRERLRDKGGAAVKGLLGKGKKGMGLAGAGAGAGGGEGGGFWSNFLGEAVGNYLGIRGMGGGKGLKGLIPNFLGGGKGGGGMASKMRLPGLTSLPKSMLTRITMLRVLGSLGPLLTNPYVLAAVAVGGLAWWLMSNVDSEKNAKKLAEGKKKSKKILQTNEEGKVDMEDTSLPEKNVLKAWKARGGAPSYEELMAQKKEEEEKRKGKNLKGLPEFATGIYEIGKTGPGMVSEGDTILDNEAAKDFRQGMGTFKNLIGHEEGIGTVTDNYLANLHAGEIQIKGGMANTMEQVINLLTDKFGSNAVFGPYGGDHTPDLDESQMRKIARNRFRKSLLGKTKTYMWNSRKNISELAQILSSGSNTGLFYDMGNWAYMGNALTELDDLFPSDIEDARLVEPFKDVMSQMRIGGKQGTAERKRHSLYDLLLDHKKSFVGGQFDLEDIGEKIKFAKKFGMSREAVEGIKSRGEKAKLESEGVRKFELEKRITAEAKGKVEKGKLESAAARKWNIAQKEKEKRHKEQAAFNMAYFMSKEKGESSFWSDLFPTMKSDQEVVAGLLYKDFLKIKDNPNFSSGPNIFERMKSIAGVPQLGIAASYKDFGIPKAHSGAGIKGSGLINAKIGEEVLEANEVAIIGAALNNAASNKVDISGSSGGGFTNIDASTPVVNNTTTNIIPPIDTDGGRGRGLGISG